MDHTDGIQIHLPPHPQHIVVGREGRLLKQVRTEGIRSQWNPTWTVNHRTNLCGSSQSLGGPLCVTWDAPWEKVITPLWQWILVNNDVNIPRHPGRITWFELRHHIMYLWPVLYAWCSSQISLNGNGAYIFNVCRGWGVGVTEPGRERGPSDALALLHCQWEA